MPFSHHSHSGQFCAHASDQLEECILKAIEKNMRVFCLTEHMPRANTKDLYPEEVELKISPEFLAERFDEYHAHALELREKYKDKITLLIGFEVDWIRPSMHEEIQSLREKYKFDMFVGSVHHVDEIPIDFTKEVYKKAIDASKDFDNGKVENAEDRFSEIEVTASEGEERMFEVYFDTQYSMLKALQPPVIGHFDLVRLLCEDYTKPISERPAAYEKMIRNIKFIASYGGLVEINSAAVRKAWTHPYPGPDVMGIMKKEGVRFALSDDSHGTKQVGYGYKRVLEYLGECGVNEVYYFEWKGMERNVQDGTVAINASLPGLGDIEMKSVRVEDLKAVVRD